MITKIFKKIDLKGFCTLAVIGFVVMAMKKGDVVRVNYVGRLESGEIFDLTDEELAKKEKVYNEKIKYKPVPVILGSEMVIPGMGEELLKMKVGEKKKVKIKPEKAFGDRKPDLVRVVPIKAFEGQITPRAGLVVDFSGMRGRIQSVSGGRVRIDFNNPLAGKILEYDLEVTEKIEGKENCVLSVFEFFGMENIDAEIKEKEAIIKGKVPEPLRKKISELITKNIEGIESVSFVESYGKYDQAAVDVQKKGNDTAKKK